ncbi:probable RNA 3'-terminal phosphate cyclase-like protein [Selaginella moellendorffii]|uniref:probable RNA 3'-terminal phosphate cyclase-like protein n=1 Tax=Selaginella moellendorffii TaxID=88036 RepID=UPI000D1C62B9|nr:probable RNA 3'-terminal phosphate cyclase-like protein [Selaginella moellendorffii]XP_024531787.1 probable RNA 3'-terminal phosphate cyclase-like protein [Selaginella moellendorffii]XP_024531788.1 probable RNA 3'-terminal phosphate cyclase-like protein [Selaginella moellendorffii]|eukprot:XP_024531786.1 probable RNA 3'-terminal phosphate cyclase-like protein [Selaginella moellendorffii]
MLNRLLPDVYIFTDHYTSSESGKSLGYGISLVTKTTTGCILSSECAATHSGASELQLPEDLGMQAAMSLLQEIKLGRVVNSAHQGLLFILCALCPEDVSKVSVGKLSSYGIKTLQHIKEFLGVQFSIKLDPATGTALLTCIGSGFQNLYRKVS